MALEQSWAVHAAQQRPTADGADGASRGPQALASAAQIKTLFSNVQAILNTNRVLLRDLRARVGEWSVRSRLGDVFLRMSDFFKSEFN